VSEATFDLDAAWQLHPRVAIRPERFGALLYHFETRKLSFLKTPTLLSLVKQLAVSRTARTAFVEAGVAVPEIPSYARALASLAASDMIIERSA
jgi:putative mycofactocin binding protein MftB